MKPLKLIITSKAKLEAKYPAGFSNVEQLLKKLVASDNKKGLDSKLFYIDDAIHAKKFGIKKTANITEKNCKDVFDAIYKKHQPAYMVIFGANDVIPFQRLLNPLYSTNPDGDDDEFVPSDLPYACEATYSTTVRDFKNPTRVVGRIPETGDIKFLERLIGNIIKHKELPKENYMAYFAVTAGIWKLSTQKTLSHIFTDTKKLLVSPPNRKKSGYTKTALRNLTHFYNCHGAPLDPGYYGEAESGDQPLAIKASDLNNKISYGTVVAAECCYGAQLSEPSEAFTSMADNYLYQNALAFLGSSTIAYGEAEEQSLADYMCEYFIKCVHSGASTGRALLEARQKFLNVSAPYLDAGELKTLAQFYILGDPSLALVKAPDNKLAGSTINNRRINLFAKGINIGMSVAGSKRVHPKKGKAKTKEVRSVIEQKGFGGGEEMLFEVDPTENLKGNMKKFMGGSTRYRIFQKGKQTKDGISRIQILVIKENDEQLLGYKIYLSR